MIVIQSYDRFDDLVLLDESTRSLEWATKTVRPELAALPVRGHCARLNGAFVYLYRSHDGHLVLNIDNRSIRLDEQVRVTLDPKQANPVGFFALLARAGGRAAAAGGIGGGSSCRSVMMVTFWVRRRGRPQQPSSGVS